MGNAGDPSADGGAGGGGHIVNVASVAGFVGLYGYTAYAASKFAVIGLSESLRQELKPLGIAVSVVCPPDVDTPGLAAELALRPRETERLAGGSKPIDPARDRVGHWSSGRPMTYTILGQ